MADELRATLLHYLQTAVGEQPTAVIISAFPTVEGWRIRRTLDALASEGAVCFRKGRNPGSRVWWMPPVHTHRD